ncbi:MAG TPA: glycosyltransferase family 4 protein [Noviherbaspirillum sp.]
MLLKVRRYDAVLIEKEIFPNMPAWMERILSWSGVPYVIDYDDAIFHGYDMSKNPVKRLLKNKIGVAMRHACVVTAGNSYLASHAASARARHIELVPTAIDLCAYPAESPHPPNERPLIGWIGTPFTVRYLEPLLPVIAKLNKSYGAELVIVGATVDTEKHPYVRSVPWHEHTEVDEIGKFDIGVMPLPDEPWERGKCGYKLIQCMACSKPVVASPVGMNVDVVQQGVNGYLARSEQEWFDALSAMLSDPELRREMGRKGRAMVEENYCVQVTAPRLVQLLKDVASDKRFVAGMERHSNKMVR